MGVASWADPNLVKSGLFYPPSAKSPEDRFRYYCSQFSMGEIDSSYYAMPSSQNAENWADWSPDGFIFNVKAFRLFTQHQTEPKVLPAAIRLALPLTTRKILYYDDVPLELRDDLWRQFKLAIEPLRQAGKLGAVHFQFPRWLTTDQRGHAHLEDIRERLQGYTLAIEFRQPSWFAAERKAATLEYERQHGLVNVVVDEPQNVIGSIPALWAATNHRLAIVRLHGRNRESWDARGLKSSTERFDYDYTLEELSHFVEPIQNLASQVEQLHVVMNNNRSDQAIRNGRALGALLGARS